VATVPADVQGPSDAELINSVRGGTIEAYGQLYERHVSAAYNLARQLTRSSAEADDLVSEAFAKVLDTLRAGRGPDVAFRAYLLTALRHTAYDKTRRDKKVELSDDVSAVSGVSPDAVNVPFRDTAVAGLERSLAAKAFARLPERWQTVLWHTEIEGQSPAEVGPLLGLTANGVSALAYRAREGLRQAYLQVHLAETTSDRCRATVDRLGAWTRDGLSKRETTQVEAHLDECERCRYLAAELADVNGALRGMVAPLVLGVGTSGYLAAMASAAKVVTGVAAVGAAAATATSAGSVAGAASSVPRQLLGVAASTAALAVAVAIGLAASGSDPTVPTNPPVAQAPVQTQTQVNPPAAVVPPAVQPPAQRPSPTPPPSSTANPPAPVEPAPAPAPAPAPGPTPPTLVPTVPSGFTLIPGELAKALPITVRNTGQTTSPPASVALNLPPGVRSVGPVDQLGGARLLALDGADDQSITCPAGSGTVSCATEQGIAPGGAATFVFRLQAAADAVGGVITGTVSAGAELSVVVQVAVEVQPVHDDLELLVTKWHHGFWEPRLDIAVTNKGSRSGSLDLDISGDEHIVLVSPCADCDLHDNTITCAAPLDPGQSYRMSVWVFGLPFRGGSVRVTATLGTATKTVVVPVALRPGDWPQDEVTEATEPAAPTTEPPTTTTEPPVSTPDPTTVPPPWTTDPTEPWTPDPTTPPTTQPQAPPTTTDPAPPEQSPTRPPVEPPRPPTPRGETCELPPAWWPPLLRDLLLGRCPTPS